MKVDGIFVPPYHYMIIIDGIAKIVKGQVYLNHNRYGTDLFNPDFDRVLMTDTLPEIEYTYQIEKDIRYLVVRKTDWDKAEEVSKWSNEQQKFILTEE